MSDHSKNWCLYNTLQRTQFRNLSFDEALSLVRQTKLGWHVWKPGWPQWKPLEACLEFRNAAPSSNDEMAQPPTPPEESSLSLVTPVKKSHLGSKRRNTDQWPTGPVVLEPEKTGQEIEFQDVDFVARKYRRVKKKFKIEIMSNGRTFASYSKDISVGGICLIDPLPPWVAGYARVRIIRIATNEAIELTCSIVENQKPEARFRVELFPIEEMDDFQSWLSAA